MARLCDVAGNGWWTSEKKNIYIKRSLEFEHVLRATLISGTRPKRHNRFLGPVPPNPSLLSFSCLGPAGASISQPREPPPPPPQPPIKQGSPGPRCSRKRLPALLNITEAATPPRRHLCDNRRLHMRPSSDAPHHLRCFVAQQCQHG